MSIQLYTTLNRNQFQSIIDKPNISVLVFLNAQWCGPCKSVKPFIYQRLSILKNYPQVIVFDIDIDQPENRDIYSFFKTKKQLTGVPTLLYFKDSIYSELCVSGDNKKGIDDLFLKIIEQNK
jgi:thiol-disulfide isomerase/thioredoxin